MWDYLATLDYGSIATQLTTNTLILAIGGWIAKTWADRRFQAIKGDQALQLEATKGELAQLSAKLNAGLEKRKLVFETHFNLEFKSCQEVWELCDEAHVIAAQTLQYIQREPIDDSTWSSERTEAIARYDRCLDICTSVRRMRPFITKRIADDANELASKCILIAKIYKEVYIADMASRTETPRFDRKPYIRDISSDLGDIREIYDRIAERISDRIEQLYVADFSGDRSVMPA